MDKIDSSRLKYRSLCHTDWPLFLALHRDRQVMSFISDPLDEETVRRHYFEPRLRPWHKGCKKKRIITPLSVISPMFYVSPRVTSRLLGIQ